MKTLLASKVDIHIFGCTRQEYFSLANSIHVPVRLLQDLGEFHGVLDRGSVRELMASADLFLDLSFWQAFGFSALEAMVRGGVPIITGKGVCMNLRSMVILQLL